MNKDKTVDNKKLIIQLIKDITILKAAKDNTERKFKQEFSKLNSKINTLSSKVGNLTGEVNSLKNKLNSRVQ